MGRGFLMIASGVLIALTRSQFWQAHAAVGVLAKCPRSSINTIKFRHVLERCMRLFEFQLRVLAAGQKSIRCVQDFDIHLIRILDLTFLACLTQTLEHRFRPAPQAYVWPFMFSSLTSRDSGPKLSSLITITRQKSRPGQQSRTFVR
jgi:hypothetical protein